MARTTKEIQLRLNASPAVSPKLVPDGQKGKATTAAVVAYQKANPPLSETGIVDDRTLAKLFPEDTVVRGESTTIKATITDWVLNYAQSRIVWAAGLLVGFIAVWVNTKLGFDIPPSLKDTITQLLVYGGGGLIVLLRGWGKDTPRVAAETPAVITKPTEYVGQEK